jgi:hypothetical protein
MQADRIVDYEMLEFYLAILGQLLNILPSFLR